MNGYSWKYRLLASSVFAGLVSAAIGTPALAQETVEEANSTAGAAAEAAEEVSRQETILVTGSRIGQSNFSAATPVAVFNSEQIDLTGAVNTAELLRTLPATGVSGFTSTNSNFFTQGSGVNTVELRNLSEDRTLVLVNGRRFVAGVPGTNAVDFNSIPTEFIERVDVVTGGASSIYGSDALAGVVNVILKDDFDGMVASYQGGISDYEDDETHKLSLTFGTDFAEGRGNALASISYSTEGGVFARDRGEQNRDVDGFSNAFFGLDNWQESQIPFYSSFSERGRIQIPGVDDDFVFDERTGEVRPFQSADENGDPVDGFNRQGFRAIAVPTERLLFSSVVNYEANRYANFFFEGTYASTDTQSELEPFPLSSEDIFGDNLAQLVDTDGDGVEDAGRFGIPILNPFVPEGIRAQARLGADLDGDGVQDIADEDLVVGFARRTTELAQRGADNLRQTARAVIGMEGDVYDTDTWTYEVSLNLGRTTQAQRSTGQINVVNFRNALNVTEQDGELVCADEIARLQGCVPINIFGKGSISPEAAAYTRAPASLDAEVTQVVANAFVTGEIGLDSPMAEEPVKTVIGAEYRSERSEVVPDALSQVGLNAGNISPVVRGDFQVAEAFAELEVPLIQGRQYAEDLTVNLSARASDYTTVGQTFAWATNVQYSPVESLRFRAQYAEAVRAPNISELFQPLSETFEGGDDPCRGATLSGGQPAFLNTANDATSGVDASTVGSPTAQACLADPLVAARVDRDGAFVPSQAEDQGIGGFNGGNENLAEETAQTITVGAVVTPRSGNEWLDRLALSIDYYNIEIEDAITTIARQVSLDQCYEESGGTYDPSSVFCENVVRYDSGPFLGAVNELNAIQQNIATIKTAGVDVQASYTLPFNDVFTNTDYPLGELTGSLNYGYIDTYEREDFPGAEPQEFAGSSGFFEHEYLLGLVYRNGGLTVAYDINWLDEAGLDTPDDELRVPSATFQDIQVRYGFDMGLELVAGVDNIADEFIRYGGGFDDTGTYTDAAIYDAIGRRYYAGFRFEF